VLTMFGRRRKVPEIKSQNAITRAQGERLAINSPIQGTAADAIKIAMIRIRERFRRDKVNVKMILQVHDELVFELPGMNWTGPHALFARPWRARFHC